MKNTNFTILHLSDFHCLDIKAFNEILSRIKDSIDKSPLISEKIKAVLFSGDLIYHDDKNTTTDKSRYKKILNPLWAFADKIQVPYRSFLFVPGNHDVVKEETKSITKRFAPFIYFVNKFRKRSNKKRGIDWKGENFESLKGDMLGTDGIYRFEDIKLRIYLINTVRNMPNSKEENTVDVDSKVLDSIVEKKEYKDEKALNIALIHNSPIIVASERRKKHAKVMSNSDRVIERFGRAGISLVLHGDEHESQHSAVVRKLGSDCWPIYTIGAGQTATEGIVTAPHFHLLNINFSHDYQKENCAEVEIISYEYDNNSESYKASSNKSYALYIPIFNEAVERSKGTIHVFELPQNRSACDNVLTKQILFRYRISAFDKIYESTKELIESQDTTIQPDHMFSFFYDSVFKIIKKNDNFWALHHGDYLAWTRETACIQILPRHTMAKKDGADIERIIILTKKEIKFLKNTKETKKSKYEDLRNFCRAMKKHRFPIYMSRENWLMNGYFKVLREVADVSSRDHGLDPSVQIGNIALFERGNDAIGFYYTKGAVNNITHAHVTRDAERISFIKGCLNTMKELKNVKTKLKNGKLALLVPCEELLKKDNLNLFLN